MKIFVTGGTGFIGANLVRELIKRNHDVGLLLRKGSKMWRIKGISHKSNLLYSDLTQAEDVSRVINAYKPDIIFHLAGYGAYPKSETDLGLMVRTNIMGTVNLFEAAGRIPIVNVGSSSEYGIKSSVMRESDTCQPDNIYGWSKLAQALFSQLKEAVTKIQRSDLRHPGPPIPDPE